MNIALVGAGGMGTAHYMNYLHIPNANVVALVGRGSKEQSQAKEWSLPLYDSISACCFAENIDMVDICTPTYTHKDLAIESLSLGKHCIVEKPIALTAEDAKAMYSCAEKNGVQLYVAQVLQFTHEIQTLQKIVVEKPFGKPLDAYFVRLGACPKWSEGNWLLDKSKSGLLPFDLHIHDLDVVVSLFGVPDSWSYSACGNDGILYKEHYRFQYHYNNGPNVCVEAAWLNAAIPFQSNWRVYFENAMLICDAKGLFAYTADGQSIEYKAENTFAIPSGINLPPSDWFYNELSHFVDCAEKNVPSAKVQKERVLQVIAFIESIE